MLSGVDHSMSDDTGKFREQGFEVFSDGNVAR